MSLLRKNNQRSKRRVSRVRAKLQMSSGLPRLSVFRSLTHIYGQVIDDARNHTLASFSSRQLNSATGDKKEIAKQVGMELAKLSLSKGIEAVKFDRGEYLYHGRVKAFAEGLREGGLKV